MKSLISFVLGLILGSWLAGTSEAQQALVIFGTASGAPKAITTDSSGNLNVKLN